jgi:hypothetical protein
MVPEERKIEREERKVNQSNSLFFLFEDLDRNNKILLSPLGMTEESILMDL